MRERLIEEREREERGEEGGIKLYVILVHVSGEWAMRNDSLYMCMYF